MYAIVRSMFMTVIKAAENKSARAEPTFDLILSWKSTAITKNMTAENGHPQTANGAHLEPILSTKLVLTRYVRKPNPISTSSAESPMIPTRKYSRYLLNLLGRSRNRDGQSVAQIRGARAGI